MSVRQRLFRPVHILFASTLCLLTACGGGGGGGGGGSSTTTLTLSGTAATGAAVANTRVDIKCSDGSTSLVTASPATNASGEYSYTFAAGAAALPCVVEVPVKDAVGNVIDTLHSLATTADNTGAAAVNITPLTEAVLAAALGQEDLASHFAGLTSEQVKSLKTVDTAAAWTALKTKLTEIGITHSAIDEPLTQKFSANSTGHDKVLDNLKTKGLTSEHLYRAAKGLTVPPIAPTGVLNDTGIDWCSENITTPATWVNNAVCSVVNWVGNLWGQQQDAFSGRDSQAKEGTLTKIGSGMAGFDFTRIASNGKPLKIQNAVWSDTGTEAAGTKWDCVRDNTTGLLWEVKRNELVSGVKHLRHKDHRYGWYNPTTTANGGAVGYETPTKYYDRATDNYVTVSGPTCTGVADSAKCNTQSYVTAVNTAGICGFKDWRMPNVDELRNLAHTGRSNPAIDTNHFPNTQADWTWSSSPYADDSDDAWSVYFGYGSDGYGSKSGADFVRLVRSGQ